MNPEKVSITAVTNRERIRCGLAGALKGRDMFIGLSGPTS